MSELTEAEMQYLIDAAVEQTLQESKKNNELLEMVRRSALQPATKGENQ